MASSSQNKFEDSLDDAFDEYFVQHFDQYFDQTFENFTIGHQEEARKQSKNEPILKETVKRAIFVCGMIISVKIQHTLVLFLADDLE